MLIHTNIGTYYPNYSKPGGEVTTGSDLPKSYGNNMSVSCEEHFEPSILMKEMRKSVFHLNHEGIISLIYYTRII